MSIQSPFRMTFRVNQCKSNSSTKQQCGTCPFGTSAFSTFSRVVLNFSLEVKHLNFGRLFTGTRHQSCHLVDINCC
jgi:hypothetical protein